MSRISQIGIWALAVASAVFAGRLWDSSASRVHAEEAPADAEALVQGRFQIAHVYYSAEKQGTIMIDSQVGRVYVLVTGKDKNGNETRAFQQLPINSCTDASCMDYHSTLLSVGPFSRDRH
jgi:hypothetical protein